MHFWKYPVTKTVRQFRRPLLHRRGPWILPPTSPLASNQNIAEIAPNTSLYLLWKCQRRQTQTLWFIITSEANIAFGRDIRYNIIQIPIHNIIIYRYRATGVCKLLLHAVVRSGSSLVNGQRLICIKATDTRNSEFWRDWTRGEYYGRQDFLFPKSYFQQTATKACFLELKYYVYLLWNCHNMSPLKYINYSYP